MLVGTVAATPTEQGFEFTYQIKNTDSAPVSLTFHSGNRFDIVVHNAEEECWRWSEGQMFTQAIETQTLESGEQLEWTAAWNPPAADTYRVRATLAAAEADVAAELTLAAV